jgi:hypothetical protein
VGRSGDISFSEWQEALRGQADAGVLRRCFEEMDSDKDGKLSQVRDCMSAFKRAAR